jgi:hypothetical protein
MSFRQNPDIPKDARFDPGFSGVYCPVAPEMKVFYLHRCSVCGLSALRRATERNLNHRIPIDKKKFLKNENTFKTSREPRKYKGKLSTGKAAPTSKRAEPLGQTSQAPMYKGSS